MPKYMAHRPSDMVSNHLHWRMPHSVANFNRAATMKITPITVLLFITSLKHLKVVA